MCSVRYLNWPWQKKFSRWNMSRGLRTVSEGAWNWMYESHTSGSDYSNMSEKCQYSRTFWESYNHQNWKNPRRCARCCEEKFSNHHLSIIRLVKVQSFITQDLGMRRMSAKFVPKPFSSDFALASEQVSTSYWQNLMQILCSVFFSAIVSLDTYNLQIFVPNIAVNKLSELEF